MGRNGIFSLRIASTQSYEDIVSSQSQEAYQAIAIKETTHMNNQHAFARPPARPVEQPVHPRDGALAQRRAHRVREPAQGGGLEGDDLRKESSFEKVAGTWREKRSV
jgi:hypothetical protein